MPGSLVFTISLDARHLDRGSPKRNQVMRPDPRPLAPHIRRTSASCPPIGSAGMRVD